MTDHHDRAEAITDALRQWWGLPPRHPADDDHSELRLIRTHLDAVRAEGEAAKWSLLKETEKALLSQNRALRHDIEQARARIEAAASARAVTERRDTTVGYVLMLEQTRLEAEPETAWEYVERLWFGPITGRSQRRALRFERAQVHALARLYNRDRRVGPMRVRRLWRKP